MFGDDYPRFIEVSELPDSRAQGPRGQEAGRDQIEQQNRMNERYEALFASNLDIFKGARVLDLASHDGRYSFAALKAGAAHVTGVEVRQELIEKAQDTFAFYDQDPDTYDFICGDMFEILEREKFDVDVVLCFGFMYHTYRHTELMHGLHGIGAKHLILDTMIMRGDMPAMRIFLERDSGDIRSAAQDKWALRRVLVGWPSLRALEMMLNAYDFEIESNHDWRKQLSGRRVHGLEGYKAGKRVTLRCRTREYARAEGLAPVPALDIPSGPNAKQKKPTPQQATPAPRWRELVNSALRKTTGFELRRTSSN